MSGQLIYSDRKDWIGRPVKTGERIMEIADVSKVVIRVDLPVAEVISFYPGARVRLFLDSDPLNPVEARLRQAGYQAKERAGVGLVYKIIAEIKSKGGKKLPRIGLRGTAQVFGRTVFLGYYLFRKPIAAFRQKFGF